LESLDFLILPMGTAVHVIGGAAGVARFIPADERETARGHRNP
jgi:hypothetical protein